MQKDLISLLTVPGSDEPLNLISAMEKDGRILSGVLSAPTKEFPIVNGFPVFTNETGNIKDTLTYEKFVREKRHRYTPDAYAAYQPFNEASRAILPFVPLLSKQLNDGDLILDLSCRTGWSGEFLAALFPNQKVVALWEGNRDVLGHSGFSFWLGEFARAQNLTVGFQSPFEPLPFRSGSFSLIYGHDLLHRAQPLKLLKECLRVGKPTATLLFPHVHLESSIPHFHRGGKHYTAQWYKNEFDREIGSSRSTFVFSEKKLFEQSYVSLRDDSTHEHYNAFVVVAKVELHDVPLSTKIHRKALTDSRAILNPLCDIDLNRGVVTIGKKRLGEQGAYLFSRHPVYEERLKQLLPRLLSKDECVVLYWVRQALTAKEIAQRMEKRTSEVLTLLNRLQESDILLVLPMSEAMVRLQHFFSTQIYLPPRKEQTIAQLFEKACAENSGSTLLTYAADGSHLTYADTSVLVETICVAFQRNRLKKGDKILVNADQNPEVALLFWAAAKMGIVTVPLSPNWPKTQVMEIVESCRPKLIFAHAQHVDRFIGQPCIVLDSSIVGEEEPQNLFSSWLDSSGSSTESVQQTKPSEGDPAIILFTSGTTGKPKGVVLSQGSLFRSALEIADYYHFTSSDVLFNPGGLYTMSGFRNPLVVPLHSGGSLVMASSEQRRHPVLVAPLISDYRVSVLSVAPGFLVEFGRDQSPLASGGFESLRLILSTASTLSGRALSTLKSFNKVSIGNYYGLTETGGACLFAETLAESGATPSMGFIGRSTESIARIIMGELYIYSQNAMLEYNRKVSREVVIDGWIKTGDLAEWQPDGQIYIRGRKREIIKDVGGELIYPSEIEEVLQSHSTVHEVAVCGYTASETEKLVAFVVLKQGIEEGANPIVDLKKWIADQLGSRKIPHYFFVVKELPKTSNEKVNKQKLIEEYQEELSA